MSKITSSITVKRASNDVYNMWANFENFPYFMKNIKSVKKVTDKTSHWVMKGPMGKDLEWDARMTTQEPNKRIAWNSIDGTIKTSGEVTFNELNAEETKITVTMLYVPPAGKVGEVASHLIDNPEKRLEEDLKNFKSYAEEKVHKY